MDKEYFFKTEQLAIWIPSGVLDTSKIRDFIDFLNSSSEVKEHQFDRFIDLTRISGISVKYQDLYPIANERKIYYQKSIVPGVKMAILVNNPLSFGMARMYQMLNDDANIEINIFETIEEVANFLQIDISILRT